MESCWLMWLIRKHWFNQLGVSWPPWWLQVLHEPMLHSKGLVKRGHSKSTGHRRQTATANLQTWGNPPLTQLAVFLTSSRQAEDTGENDIIEYIKPSHISGREHLTSETATTLKPSGISIYGSTFTDRHALYKASTITLHSLHRVPLRYCKCAFVHCTVSKSCQ